MSISSYQKRGIYTLVLATVIVSVVLAVTVKFNETETGLTASPAFSQKAQVLNFAKAGQPLDSNARGIIFQYLGEAKLLQYAFTAEEKAKLIKVLNSQPE